MQAGKINHGEREYLNLAGVKLEIKRYSGAKHLPTLVFLHEGLGCVDMWRDFPKKLSSLTGCSALVYSRQGYGRSDPCSLPRSQYYMHDEALQVLPQLLTAIGIEEHFLIGHSDGGSIALIYAGKKPRAGLLGVVTMAPHIFCEDKAVYAIQQTKQAFLKGKLRSGLEKYHRNNTDCAFWGWNKAWLDPDFVHWNIEGFLPGINVPQLVLQGEDDEYGTALQYQAIEKHSGGPVAVRLLAACRHTPFEDQAEQSLELIKDFITLTPGTEIMTAQNKKV